MKEYISEQLTEVNDKIKKLESKQYRIYDVSMIVNDRKEYDILIGEQRTLERMLNLVKREGQDKEILELKEKINNAENK